MFEVTVEETFAAGHALRNYHGKCENVHGHNYKVRAKLEGEQLDEAGLLVDFNDVKRVLNEIIDRVDHKFLNDVAPFDKVSLPRPPRQTRAWRKCVSGKPIRRSRLIGRNKRRSSGRSAPISPAGRPA
jgi:queuosine biosynthesis protein QueD